MQAPRLVQFLDDTGATAVACASEDGLHLERVEHTGTLYELALEAAAAELPLATWVARLRVRGTLDYRALEAEGRLRPPLEHPDPAHLLISGTGLTHLGSASARDAMHRALESDRLTDSLALFRSGLEGGRPPDGSPGVQPEWFYKGDGARLVAPGAPLEWPAFAEDASEEPEIVGLYVIDRRGRPWRVGFALGNECSDHALERRNYLYLAHSKLRTCAVGPELRLGALPPHIEGRSRIFRAGALLWERPFLSGEANMTHDLASLEHHHFKYAAHRRPGDVHLHFFGTATLSFAEGLRTEEGDVFEIEAPGFGRPLRNTLRRGTPEAAPPVRAL